MKFFDLQGTRGEIMMIYDFKQLLLAIKSIHLKINRKISLAMLMR